MKKYLFFLLIMGLFFSCASRGTKLSGSWHNPDSTTTVNNLNKIVVLAMTNNDAQRRQIEDSFSRIFGSKAVGSYRLFKQEVSNINQDSAVAELESDGFDGAMVVRLVDSKTSGYSRSPQVHLRPNIYYRFGGNLNAGIGLDVEPGYNNRKEEYYVETSLYEFPSEDLIWSSTTTTSNPSSLTDMINQVVSKVDDKLQDDGVK